MASNSTSGDPSSSAMPNTTVAKPLASNPTQPAAPTVVAPSVRPIASANAQQLQPNAQQRAPPFQHYRPQRPHRHHPYQLPQPTSVQTQTQTHPIPHLGKASEPIQYPLASSGRGLRGMHPRLPEQAPNSGAYPPMSSSIVVNSSSSQQYQPPQARFSAPVDFSHPTSQLLRGTFLHPSHPHVSPVSLPAARGIPLNNQAQSKVGSSLYSAPDFNAPKDLTDKSTDDKFVTIRDRKVRISDGASLYALCRSWLRNGYLEESQPQYGDAFRPLPKPLPLPLPLPESSSPKRKESDEETESDEVEKLDEIPSTEELLTRHVKRAKRVRARLKEERLQRIERYKCRLGLLFPPNASFLE